MARRSEQQQVLVEVMGIMKSKFLLLVALVGVALVGCGEKKVDSAEAEKTQTSTANEQSQSGEAK